jgi:hypothetical protein
MNTLSETISRAITPPNQLPRLLLVQTFGRPSAGLAELFARLALRGPFYAIAGGEWLPTYALVQALRRQTPNVRQVLDRVRLARPFTCYQLLDLLTDIRPERDPILLLDFLHHFHNSDIQLDVRLRVLDQCCRRLERLSLARTLLVFVQAFDTDEYRSFYPLVARVAGEILLAPDPAPLPDLQPAML